MLWQNRNHRCLLCVSCVWFCCSLMICCCLVFVEGQICCISSSGLSHSDHGPAGVVSGNHRWIPRCQSHQPDYVVAQWSRVLRHYSSFPPTPRVRLASVWLVSVMLCYLCGLSFPASHFGISLSWFYVMNDFSRKMLPFCFALIVILPFLTLNFYANT